MKKIIIVGPAYPYRGGQSMVEAYLHHTLTEAGYDVHTITFTMLYPSLLFPGKTQYDKSENTFFRHDDKIYRIINSVNPISWYNAFRKIKSLSADLTIFVWWMPFFAPAYYTIGQLVKRFTRSKISFLVENYISHEHRWFEIMVNKATLDIADAFICQSGFVKRNIQAFHTKQPVHQITLSIYDCYDLGRYSQEAAREKLGIKSKHVVLFFGLIRKYKGLDKLLQSMKYIHQKMDDVFLLAVGECYEDFSYYEQIRQQEGISDHSQLINQFVDNEDIEPYFKAADVVVLPYNSASQSGILMMAYGFKKPVIVNNVGGLPELVMEGQTGYITPSNAPEDLAEGIVKTLQHPDPQHFAQAITHLNQSLGYGTLSQIIENITTTHA